MEASLRVGCATPPFLAPEDSVKRLPHYSEHWGRWGGGVQCTVSMGPLQPLPLSATGTFVYSALILGDWLVSLGGGRVGYALDIPASFPSRSGFTPSCVLGRFSLIAESQELCFLVLVLASSGPLVLGLNHLGWVWDMDLGQMGRWEKLGSCQ